MRFKNFKQVIIYFLEHVPNTAGKVQQEPCAAVYQSNKSKDKPSEKTGNIEFIIPNYLICKFIEFFLSSLQCNF